MNGGLPESALRPCLHELDLRPDPGSDQSTGPGSGPGPAPGYAAGTIGRSRHFAQDALTEWFESTAAAADAGDAGGSHDSQVYEAAAVTVSGDEIKRVQDRFVEDMLILVSEVVTNACVHTSGPRGLVVDCTPERLRIEVTDPSPVLPVPRVPDPEWPGGYGLFVVQRLARAWGSEPRDGGKAVWLEVDWPDQGGR